MQKTDRSRQFPRNYGQKNSPADTLGQYLDTLVGWIFGSRLLKPKGIIHTVELLIWMIQLALLEKYHRLTKNSVLD